MDAVRRRSTTGMRTVILPSERAGQLDLLARSPSPDRPPGLGRDSACLQVTWSVTSVAPTSVERRRPPWRQTVTPPRSLTALTVLLNRAGRRRALAPGRSTRAVPRDRLTAPMASPLGPP